MRKVQRFCILECVGFFELAMATSMKSALPINEITASKIKVISRYGNKII